MPSIEFVVDGPPVSHQTKNKKALQAWMAQVRAVAAPLWAGAPSTGLLQCTIVNFYAGPAPPLDDDNMVKPIRDAMNGLVYEDDKQIRVSYHAQWSNQDYFQIQGASKIIVDALQQGREFVYVKIEDAPLKPQLPK
jgi:hypothetical protein